MPCQVSGKSVAIKLQPSVHTLGAEAAAADGAFIGMTSAAQASTPQEAPPAAMITAAKMPSFAMRASLAQRARLYVGTKLVGNTEPAPYTVMPENSDPSGSRATVSAEGQRVRRHSCCGATDDQSQLRVIRAVLTPRLRPPVWPLKRT